MAGGQTSPSSLLMCCRCRCRCVVICVVAAAAVAALALYLVLRPHVIQASVEFADLATFTLEPRTWILRYNLTLDVQLRNPNQRVAIAYHHVRAQASYQAQRFGYDDRIPDFFQGSNSLTTIYPAFLGQLPLVGGVAAAGFRREASENSTFSIDVKLDARTELKLWIIKVPGPSPKIDCPLGIRRRNRETGELRPGSFYPTKCTVAYD